MHFLLRVLVFARICSLAISTAELGHVEITPSAAQLSRIVRHEQGSALLQEGATAGAPGDAEELTPDIMGSGTDNTYIVQSGEGPTTTIIYKTGFVPTQPPANGGINENATALKPIYEAGPPGPPGVNGPPGPPGEPGPAEGVAPGEPGPVIQQDSASRSSFEVRGDSGGEGAPGPMGAEGGLGTHGLEGDLGPRGHLGNQGPKGGRGPPGKPNHAKAAKHSWLIGVIAANGVFTLFIFAISYLEFVKQTSPYNWFCGGGCAGCCGEKKAKAAPAAEEGGYEQ